MQPIQAGSDWAVKPNWAYSDGHAGDRRDCFFQAEDGIRDESVTGVQTWLFRSVIPNAGPGYTSSASDGRGSAEIGEAAARSEERRVGEEGRTPGAPGTLKKKKAGGGRRRLAREWKDGAKGERRRPRVC